MDDDETVILDGVFPPEPYTSSISQTDTYIDNEPEWHRPRPEPREFPVVDLAAAARRRRSRRRRTWWMTGGLALLFFGLFGVGAGLGLLPGPPGLPTANQSGSPPAHTATALSRSAPTRIAIPAIGVSAPIMSVGLATDGAIGTPPLDQRNLAGWYAGGPSPGETGPAIIVGHVDGPSGESVFYHLDSLKPGNTVRVTRADGKVAVFTIYSVAYYPKGKFPGTQVYGNDGRPDLRLITCGGPYLGGEAGYADNVVAYASLRS